MPLIDRVTRLFRADLHAVIDRIEEPQVLLRQALREMEEELAQAAARLKATQLEREQLQRRSREIEQSLAGIGGELDLCFAAGNEALVRTLLRRRLEGERVLQALRQREAACARRLAEDGTRQAERQRELEQLRQRAMLFQPDEHAAEGAPRFGDDLAVSEADVDLALLREREARRTK
jgi:phage shock protein A